MRNLRELNINEGGKRVNRPSPSNELIRAFEACYGITLPEDYVKLLRYSNGGHPELDTIAPIGRPGASPWAVNHFCHLSEDRTSAESLWAAMEEWRPVLGNKALPIAEEGGGNPFFLDLATPAAAVKGCIHDDNFAVVELAPSFQAFIDGLSLDSDDT